MSSHVPFIFNNMTLFTVTVDGKFFTCAKEVCRALEYGKTTKTADALETTPTNVNRQSSFQKQTLWTGPRIHKNVI